MVETRDLGAPGAEMGSVDVFSTSDVPPGPRPAGTADLLPSDLIPGGTKWFVIQWPAGASFGMHHTDSIDYDVVMAGSIDLVLDDGPHRLEAGDVVVVPGVDHGWTAGPAGCTLSVCLLGTPPHA